MKQQKAEPASAGTNTKKQKTIKLTKDTGNSSSWPGAFGIYKTTKQAVMVNLSTLLLLILLNVLLQGVASANKTNNNLEILPTFITGILNIIFTTAFILTWLAGLKQQKISVIESIKESFGFFISMFLGTLLTGLATVASLLLFIIPFFFVFPRLVFVPYLIIDKNISATDAFAQSWEMSKGHVSKVYGIFGANLLFGLLVFTIIGIPFALYFLFMYSAATAVLYKFITSNQ